MRRLEKQLNWLDLRLVCPGVPRCFLAAAIVLQIASRAEAHIDFGVDCASGVIRECVLVPILREEQFLIPVSPLPDPFPPLSNLPSGTPPFVEIFDIPGLVGVEPPPPFEARVRMFGDPSPQPNIVDSPNIPNLLLIFAGANQIMGPEDFEPFELQLPPHVTQLQFFGYAFDAQGNPVINVGQIEVPEPSFILLFACGAAMCAWFAGHRHRFAKEAQ